MGTVIQSPEFSRTAAAVMNSAYFYETFSGRDLEEKFRLLDEREAERSLLADALETAVDEESLPPDVQEVWGRALATLDQGDAPPDAEEGPADQRAAGPPRPAAPRVSPSPFRYPGIVTEEEQRSPPKEKGEDG